MGKNALRKLGFVGSLARFRVTPYRDAPSFAIVRARPILIARSCVRATATSTLQPNVNTSKAATPTPTPSPSDEHASSLFHPSATFASLGMSPELCQSLARAGITRPTRVQAVAIPRILNGLQIQMKYYQALRSAEERHEQSIDNGIPTEGQHTQPISSPSDAQMDTPEFVPPPPPQNDDDDVLLIGAETGSGKTLAYLLPFVEALRQHPDTGVKAVLLMPSRELCAQVLRFFNEYIPNPPRALILSGGLLPDVSDLLSVRVFIATPAALLNYMNFSIRVDKNDKYIVVDEADMLLSGSFLAEVEEVLSQPSMKPFATRRNSDVRARNRNRLIFVGATFPHWTGERVKSIITWMRRRYPGVQEVHTEDIHRRSTRLASTWRYVESEEERVKGLCEVLRDNVEPSEKVMVFAATAGKVERVKEAVEHKLGMQFLQEKFGGALMLHKKIMPKVRAEALHKFVSNETRLLFCTDLASRGLDLGLVTRVVEYEFAENVVGHLHRIGRTARAGEHGRTDHFFDEVSKPLADAIRNRDERNENVVDGVFSRKRSFRRKLKKWQAETAIEKEGTMSIVSGDEHLR